MGQIRNSNKKSTIATAEDYTRKSKSEVAPLRPAGTPAPTGTKPSPERPVGPTHEQIAQRAHELWVKNGSRHGEDQRHWLEAEAQLKREMGSK